MQLVFIKGKSPELDDFLIRNKFASLQQTKAWIEFQSEIPGREKSWRIAVFEKGEIVAYCSLFCFKTALNYQWLYIPSGPLLSENSQSAWSIIWQEIKKIAKQEKALFIRIEPPFENDQPNALRDFFVQEKFSQAHDSYQPRNTLMLDLKPNVEEILSQMKPKGRYNIRLAEKKGVSIHEDNSDEAIEAFSNLVSLTGQRNKFSGHNFDYYKNFLTYLNTNNQSELDISAKLYLARHENQPIAGIIVTWFKNVATYYFGASDNEKRNLMAPYLLQWRAISDAKNQDIDSYDFFGIAPANQPNHPWQKITEFKLKFGGQEISYVPAHEFVFAPFKFRIFLFAKFLRKLIRGR
jgi:lipid II:glycine glycyltransferase (peptidoglycan interpeptide bridge formation enzyme)